MLEWIKEEDGKPEYEKDVLLWFDCEKCRKNEYHCHNCLAGPFGTYNTFYHGRYCKGYKDYLYAEHYPKETLEDHWQPKKPSHWAYVNSPFEGQENAQENNGKSSEST